MDAPVENPKSVQKKRRLSRFRTVAEEKPTPNNTHVQQPQAPTPTTNSAVSALRTRFSQPSTTPNSSNVPAAAPAKRRRTGRSRFSEPTPSIPVSSSAPPPPSKPSSLKHVTSIPVQPYSTLSINKRLHKDRQVASVLRVSEADLLETDPTQNPYFDPAIRIPGRTRTPRPEFKFVQKNEIVAKAEQQRAKANILAIQEAYKAQLRENDSQQAFLPVLPPLAEDLRFDNALHTIPEWEWWDLPFIQPVNDQIGEGDVQEAEFQLRERRITHYIHHPPPIKPAISPRPPPVLPLMLTKKEAKKLRRQRRQEVHKEQQEMIAAGLLPPPPPKVKLSNMMRVLANETTADPTKIDAEVRAQMEERRRKHEAENAANKKTKEERREKAMEKINIDKEAGLFAVVFRVTSMQNPQHRFKVGVNARQLGMTGTVVLAKNFCIVVAEGGAKTVRKFKKLMLRRINWTDDEVTVSAVAENSSDGRESSEINVSVEEKTTNNSCLLVWEGAISSSAFDSFQTVTMRNDSNCRHHFKKHSVEHFWDLCVQATPLGNQDIGVRQLD